MAIGPRHSEQMHYKLMPAEVASAKSLYFIFREISSSDTSKNAENRQSRIFTRKTRKETKNEKR